MGILYREARYGERLRIIDLSKLSTFTAGFSNTMFSGSENFANGWIGVAVSGEEIVGFVCLRHKKLEPCTVVYDIGVHPDYKRRGIGGALLRWAFEGSPHNRVKLNVDITNTEAHAFYRRLGFRKIGEGWWGKGKSARPYNTLSVNRGAFMRRLLGE